MEKVDIVIGTVGFVAILATVLGVVFYEELAGEEDFKFRTSDAMLDAQSGNLNGATTFEFTLPDNATEAHIMVQLVCVSGQAVDPATTELSVSAISPYNNSTTGPATFGSSIGAGTTCDNTNVGGPEMIMVDLAPIPDNFTGVPSEVAGKYTYSYGNNTLSVTVSASATSAGPGLPVGPVGNFVFAANVDVEVTTFKAIKETAEAENVQ